MRAYPHRIAAICAGNETQVSWSAHRVAPTLLIGYIRELRARTAAPVTTADDLNYWTTPASRVVAREVDFVCTHLHPLWAGQTLDDALPWMKRQYAAVHALHPARTLVIGETGWATGKLSSGEQSTLMKGQPDEAAQAAFCHAAAAWIHREHITTFFFEAFDENWKGGPDPADAEKHWGFFHADRTPKPVVRHAEN